MMVLALNALGCQHQPVIEALPAEFKNDRIYLVPMMPDGSVVRFITDTGGGWNAIKWSVATKIDATLSASAEAMPFPNFAADYGIPANSLFRDGNLVLVEDKELDKNVDGFLGGRWFGNRTWEFDYLQETLSLLDEIRAHTYEDCQHVSLGFQVNAQGARTMHFARMSMEVDAQSIEVLLDTGAKAHLTEHGAEHFGNPDGSSVGTSFISQSIFDVWTARHPDWKVVQSADSVGGQTFAMVEVPIVTIGDHSIGPVWFTARPDNAFVEYMSSMMDDTVFGALGGSALKYFRVIVDYPNARAYFCTD
ncbi:MAG: hypothetical protein AAF351_01070 [Pseudomonadota bacterium]